MKRIREGNDVSIKWAIKNKGVPYDLEGKDIKFGLVKLGKIYDQIGFTVSGNIISFIFYGKDHSNPAFGLGKYGIILIENDNQKGMVTIDSCDAFQLVEHSCLTGGNVSCGDISVETVELESDVNTNVIKPIIPEVGPNGNWFIEGLDTGKPSRGEKGDAFTYDDFTQSQLEGLRGPRGFDGSILYPKFEVREDMHLVVESKVPTNRVMYDEDSGHLYLNLN